MEPHEVAGYVAGSLDPDVRARIETHLSDCEPCAAEVADVVRLRRKTGSPIRWVGIAAAAAAMIAVVVVSRPSSRPVVGTTPVVRGDTGTSTVSMVQPANDAALPEPPVFVWRAVPGATAYRITVSRADGDSVWTASLPDTTARAPGSSLAADTYYWYVDAILADGSSRAGTPQRFSLTP
jgi:anti-sigma factor RsiW